MEAPEDGGQSWLPQGGELPTAGVDVRDRERRHFISDFGLRKSASQHVLPMSFTPLVIACTEPNMQRRARSLALVHTFPGPCLRMCLLQITRSLRGTQRCQSESAMLTHLDPHALLHF